MTGFFLMRHTSSRRVLTTFGLATIETPARVTLFTIWLRPRRPSWESKSRLSNSASRTSREPASSAALVAKGVE